MPRKQAVAPMYNLPPTLKTPCVLQINGEPFGGKELGVTTSISTYLRAVRTPDKDSYLSLVIEFPLPNEVEAIGFGKCHHAKKHMSWVEVFLGENTAVSVNRFGIPYSNPCHPAEDWLRSPDTSPVLGGLSFLDIFQQRHFCFLAAKIDTAMMSNWSVASLAPRFDYGYGSDQSWDLERYMKQLHEIKGHRFQTAWSFETDASHVTALTQSIVQDFMWIQKWCLDMTTKTGSAYFVKHPASRQSKRWLAIVKMEPGLWKQPAWSQACINGTMKLVVHPGPDEIPDSWTEDLSERWSARICHDPDEVRLLKRHPLTEKDFVIRVIEPVQPQLGLKKFDSREEADAAYETDQLL
ncbi:hypothetical protein FMEXI_13221 [Fusarium mexicanum]|uniref:Uncharacterized protein n=1 Tax=Fusarium mexicanum TaxID=751941 RepID=A0A8H5I605_9HYPO|nr:hypothetical protein FMEXI_13221 [Fusarium mexicanum]